jgi:FMN phosphatase YigB (HAD superfamily)
VGERTGTSVGAVVFDIGETLLDRTREYAAWAEFFGVPAHTFSAVFGGIVTRGGSVSDVLRFFGSGATTDELYRRRGEAGIGVELSEADLYPDVRSTIATLRERGCVVGIAGNQPASVSEQLRGLDLGADFVGSSSEWGVSKPAPGFFLRAADEAGVDPARAVYVGDQLDNDVVAPLDAGLKSVRVIRGPWGYLNRDAEIEARCLAVVERLEALPDLLSGA